LPTQRATKTRWPLAGLALLGALLALSVLSCTSRTVPLPPPTIDSIAAPNEQGLTVVRGTAEEGASVGVLNETSNQGVIVASPESGCEACPFEARLPAETGDKLRLWQFRDTANPRYGDVP
jgi:hypothetical protein